LSADEKSKASSCDVLNVLFELSLGFEKWFEKPRLLTPWDPNAKINYLNFKLTLISLAIFSC
jgi:hypothetical protein